MRRAGAYLLSLTLALCSGCAAGIGGTYRNIEELQIIETLGFDSHGGAVLATAATGRDASGREVLRAAGAGEDVTAALRDMRELAGGGDLFFDSTGHILLGEAAAEEAGRYFDYIGRSGELRLDTPLIVVRGGEAAELVLSAGGDAEDVTSILSALEHDTERSGTGFVPSCSDIAVSLERSGSALALAVRTAKSTAGDFDTAENAGYAIFSGGELAGYLDGDAALGAAMLSGRAGRADIGAGGVSARLIRCGCELEPVWEGDKLRALRFRLDLRGSVTEAEAYPDLASAARRGETEEALASEAERMAASCLATSQALGADFLGIGAELERRFPGRWKAIAAEWDELFRAVDVQVEAEWTLLRSYGYDTPPGLGEEG